jgi:hypothetical protein
MSIEIKAKCDICGKQLKSKIKYVGQAPDGWYTLRYQAKSGRIGSIDICSDMCLLKYSLRMFSKKSIDNIIIEMNKKGEK